MRSSIVSAAAAVLSGCYGMAHDDRIDGPYRLVAIDAIEEMQVAYDLGDDASIGRIPATVFWVGFDARYIVAARHPDNDRSITQYFYLVRALDGPIVDPNVTVRGPFDRATFAQETTRLGLPPLTTEVQSLK
jgi:hypothetical protein